mgnify:CR=1 FL=1
MLDIDIDVEPELQEIKGIYLIIMREKNTIEGVVA